MANHPQAAKRNRQRTRQQERNRHFKTTMRTHVKRVRAALAARSKEQAIAALKVAGPLIDSCAQKGVIPRGRASRLVSRLNRAVNALS